MLRIVALQNYLKYLHDHLGIKDFVAVPWDPAKDQAEAADPLSAPIVNEVARVEEANSTPEFMAEASFDRQGQYSLLFVRVQTGYPSLQEDSSSLELFNKLRAALGYSAQTAPWIEADLSQWQDVVEVLRSSSDKILLMFEDKIERSNADLEYWMIPDPYVMSEHVDLKRPAWELLKEWKQNV